MSLEQTICEAVDILVNKAVNEAKFDRTIQATIVSCVDAASKKYKIKYQDSTFYAFGEKDEIYSTGTTVYILVPENDMTRNKTIIGTVKQLGDNYVDTSIAPTDKYEIIGTNCIQNNSEFALCSYESDDNEKNQIILYDKEKNIDNLNIDIQGLEDYIKKSNAKHIMIGGTFRTSLPVEQQSNGDYGIIVKIAIKNAAGNKSINTYILNIEKMTGNPFKFISEIEQKTYFEIDGKNFIELQSVVFYCKNFLFNAEQKPHDIFVNKLNLTAVNRLTETELSSYSLSIVTPRGTYFDDINIGDKRLEAEVRLKGQLVSPTTQNLFFYWFEEKAGVNYKSAYYNRYGGQGWKCLNSYNLIETDSGPQKDWIPDDNLHIVTSADMITTEKKYKCVVKYNEIILSKEIIIRNYMTKMSVYDIVLSSSGGTEFFMDNGSTEISCNVFLNNKEIDKSKLNFIWASVDSENNYNFLNSINETDKRNSIFVQIPSIVNFTTFKCEVNDNDNNYIGTASLTITNLLEESDTLLYSLFINNGSQMFIYTEEGIAPTNPSLDKPLALQPLTFYVYDNTNGNIINGDTIHNSKIKWFVPKEKTMLEFSGEPADSTQDYNIYYGSSLTYTLRNPYNIDNQRNNIKLEVEFDKFKLVAYTNFTISKQGEMGTNGSSVSCRIIPNTQTSVFDNSQWLSLKLPGNEFNVDLPVSQWFKVQLWENGKKVQETISSTDDMDVRWSILRNNYGSVIDDSDITVSQDGSFRITPALNNNRKSNIVKVEVIYNKKVYYANFPIVTIKQGNNKYNIEIVAGSGFKYVLYRPDGTKPIYDNTNPFTLKVTQADNDVSLAVNYNWGVVGGRYVYTEDHTWTWVDQPDISIDTRYAEVSKNQVYIKPTEHFIGDIVTNAVVCDIAGPSGEFIATIHIPIHMYFNRYSNAALNGWDGNSVEISDEGGFILAPQIGAGVKHDDNSFTGIVMGEIQEANNSHRDIGLVGFAQGKKSIFLDAETGEATFGVAGAGQIHIDPSNRESRMASGDFSEINGTGMEINFSTPHIKFGSGNFGVTPEGILTAQGAKILGDFFVRFGPDTTDPDNNTALSSGTVEFSKKKGIAIESSYLDKKYGNTMFKLNSEDMLFQIGSNPTETSQYKYATGISYTPSRGLYLSGNFSNYIYGNDGKQLGFLLFNKQGIDIEFNQQRKNLQYDVFKLTTKKFIIGKALQPVKEIGIAQDEIEYMESGLYYNNGDFYLSGNFTTNVYSTDKITGQQVKVGYLKFNNRGLDIFYKKKNEVLKLTNDKIVMGTLVDGAEVDDLKVEDYEVKNMKSGLYYKNGSIYISGAFVSNVYEDSEKAGYLKINDSGINMFYHKKDLIFSLTQKQLIMGRTLNNAELKDIKIKNQEIQNLDSGIYYKDGAFYISGSFATNIYDDEEVTNEDGSVSIERIKVGHLKFNNRGLDIEHQNNNNVLSFTSKQLIMGKLEDGMSLSDVDIKDQEILNLKSGLYYKNGALYLSGNFATNIYETVDGEQEKVGHLKFNSRGLDIFYQRARTIFNLTTHKFIMGMLENKDDTLNDIYIEPDSEGNVAELKGLKSGLYFSDGKLFLNGSINATSGTIGGWKIKDDRIEAADGVLKLYADGRIVGVDNKKSSGYGGIGWETDYEKTEINAGNIKFYANPQKDDEGNIIWGRQGMMKARKSDSIQPYLGFPFQGSLTLTSWSTRPLLLSARDRIVAAVIPDLDKVDSHILLPLAETKQQGDEEASKNEEQKKAENTNDEEQVEEEDTRQKVKDDCTKLYGNKIFTKNITVPIGTFTDLKEGEDKYEQITGADEQLYPMLKEESLIELLQYTLRHPYKIKYTDGTTANADKVTIDTITEFWKIPVKSKLTEIKREIKIEVKNKGESEEEVLCMILPDESKIELEGF